jgi:hypothetical protein
MDAWKAMDAKTREEQQKAGTAAWQQWVATNQSSIVDMGTSLGKTRQISAPAIADIRNDIRAYTVVRADSHGAAAELFEKHSHFTIFPGESVEVMECLPLPGM